MKKILLLIAAVISCVATYPQIDNPALDIRNLRITKKQGPAIAKSAIPREPGALERKPNDLNHGPENATTFDPAWANRFQTVLDSVMLATGGKGASMAVYTPEEGQWTGVSGTSDGLIPVSPQMRFGIGSNTKLFIAITMVRLQEEGILSLDDHLYQWLPSIQYVDSTITIRQLLTHQSGIWDYWNDSPSIFDSIWADTSRFWTTEEIIGSIRAPHFAPGNGYRYSNTNYVLAGMIIEAATGETWVQKLHDIIFDPLELDSTFVGAFEPRNGPVAAEWDAFFGHLITNSPMTAEYSQANACGAILATASEMVQWYNALLNGSIISDSSLQMVLTFDPSSLYGLGIQEGGGGAVCYAHTGGMMGYVSIILYDTQRKAIICILCNDRQSNFENKRNSLFNVFFFEYPRRTKDAGIADITSPWEHNCSTAVIPEVELKNFGSDPLTSVSINYRIDEGAVSVFDWTGLLDPGETVQVVLPSIIPGEGAHGFCCYTSQPNGEPEGYTFNDTLRSNFFINTSTPAIPGVFEGFDGNGFPQEGWTLSSSSIFQWGETMLARLDGSGAGVKNNSHGFAEIGTYYDLELPLLNIAGLSNTGFSFDYAYAPFPGIFGDSLRVSVSEDCGASWQTLFYDGGKTLRTASYHNQVFYPESPDEWKHESYSLSGFEGDFLIRFRMRYGAGNNLYLDNILVGMPVSVDEGRRGINKQIAVSIYPDPFCDATTIEYELEEAGFVNLTMYSYIGQEVKTLANGQQSAGKHRMQWNAEGIPAGIYFYRVQAGKEVGSGKMIKL